VPYRGGDVNLQVGLFSVKSTDLVGPYLKVLEEMANAAGVSFVKTAMPFIGPIIEGINLLAGAGSDIMLEIGLSKTLDSPQTGEFVLLGAKQGTVNVSSLRVDLNYVLLDEKGNPVEAYPYIVLGVQAAPNRDDWFNIPDVKDAYASFNERVRKGDLSGAKSELANFKRTAITSPDLLTSDAIRLGLKVEGLLKDAQQPIEVGTADVATKSFADMTADRLGVAEVSEEGQSAPEALRLITGPDFKDVLTSLKSSRKASRKHVRKALRKGFALPELSELRLYD